MALSSELMQRLGAEDEPLPKRLKLAENAYCSTDLAISGKENLIVKWLCGIVLTDPVALKTLSVCTYCQGSNNRTILNRDVQKDVINTLVNQLNVDKDTELVPPDVISCCNHILSDSAMHHYFQSSPKTLGYFMHHLFIRLKSDENRINQDEERTAARRSTVLKAVESLVQIYKQHSEKDQLAAIFLDQILSPLCSLIDPTSKDNTNRIGAEAHKCIQQILFGKSRYCEYKEYSGGKGDVFLPSLLFETVDRLVRQTNPDDARLMLNYVFGACTGAYKTDPSLVDFVFRRLINASAQGAKRTMVSNVLIQYLTDIPIEYGNKIDGVDLTQFLNNLIDQVLSEKEFTEDDYSLLRHIASLNPLVIESKIQSVLTKIMLKPRSKESEQISYLKFLICILNAGSKLRREQKLIPWVLLALKAALTEDKTCALSASQILPSEFTDKFTELVVGLNSPQIVAMLKSLTFHLKTNCVEAYDKKEERDQVLLMAECTVLLIVSFFNGIRIYEHSVPLAVQQKFVAALREFGEVLSELKRKVLNAEDDPRITIVLFDTTLFWSKVQSMLEFYAPRSEAQNIPFPILEVDLRSLIKKVEEAGDQDCKKSANKLLLHRMKIGKPPLVQFSDIIGGIKKNWPIVIDDYPELVQSLSVDQLSEIASLILKDILAGKRNLIKWSETLEQEILQEDERFLTTILCQTFKKIGSIMKGSACASIIARINLENILKDATTVPALGGKRLIGDLLRWDNIEDNDFSRIEKSLQTLLCVPLSFFSVPLRTITFVTIYVLGRECDGKADIRTLCDNILSETIEEGGLNVFQYVDPTSLLPLLPGSKVLQNAFQLSLKNTDMAVSILEDLLSVDDCPEIVYPFILSCIENVKPKLSNEEKLAIGIIEKKLAKKALSKLENDSRSTKNTQSLYFDLKLASKKNRIKESLKEQIRNKLHSIFVDDEDKENSESRVELINEGLKLAVLVLQNRARVELSEDLMADIWKTVLKHPDMKILTPLLEATVPKVFNDVLPSLLMQTESDLRNPDSERLKKTFGIWECVIKSDMGRSRNKARLNAARSLFKSLQNLNIAANHWPAVLQLLTTIINTKHMVLAGEHIDMMITIGGRSLREGGLPVYDEFLLLALALLKSKIGLMTDRLPPLLQVYRQVFDLIVQRAKNDDLEERHQLSLCALNAEKVTSALVKLKRDMSRICPYMIADMVNSFDESDLRPAMKESFKNCINALMSICDDHGMSFLVRNTAAGKREVFKNMSESYKKYNRYTGKI